MSGTPNTHIRSCGDTMSTRGLKGFKYDNKTYGVYNHFDSYPSGLGMDMIRTIDLLPTDLKPIYENIKKLNIIPSDDGAKTLYEQSQDGDYITNLLTGKNPDLLDGFEFIYDSLFCEYAYIIDFDKEQLLLFRGYQKDPQKDNMFGTNQNHMGYYPCVFRGSIPFEEIRTKTVNYLKSKLMEIFFEGNDE